VCWHELDEVNECTSHNIILFAIFARKKLSQLVEILRISGKNNVAQFFWDAVYFAEWHALLLVILSLSVSATRMLISLPSTSCRCNVTRWRLIPLIQATGSLCDVLVLARLSVNLPGCHQSYGSAFTSRLEAIFLSPVCPVLIRSRVVPSSQRCDASVNHPDNISIVLFCRMLPEIGTCTCTTCTWIIEMYLFIIIKMANGRSL